MKNPTAEISITFDIGMLAQLALKEASKMRIFKGKELSSEAVFYNDDETMFNGIKIIATDPNP